MRKKLAAVVSVFAASLVASACSDQPSSTPTAPLVRLPRTTSATLSTLTCDINSLKANARDFAASSSDQLLKNIGELQKLTPGSDLATDKVFDALSRMAVIRGTTAQRSGVPGVVFDSLVHRLFGCANSAVTANALDQDFRTALGPGWVFEVRGGSGGAYPDSSGGAYERGSLTPNWWAVEAPTGWAAAITSTVTKDRVLIYGYETSYLNAGGRFGGSSIEHRTVPGIATGVFGLSVNVGLCVADGSSITSTARLNHNYKFLPLINTLTCSPPADFTATTGSLALGALNPVRLAKQAFGFLMPEPAFAAFAAGSVGGAPSELSPSAVYDLSFVKLRFDTIANGFVNTELKTTVNPPTQQVRVWSLSPDNQPVPGVGIKVRIVGNSSSIALFGTSSGADSVVTRTTNQDGYTTLDGVSVNKAGGYRLGANVDVVGVTGATVFRSNAFNIQNKAAP